MKSGEWMADTTADAEERFRALFGRCSRPLLTYALRRVREPADAADVVAETFVVAWRRLDEIPPGGEARLWLFGVARRVVANHQRGGLRRSRLADRLRAELSEHVDLDPMAPVEIRQVVAAALARLDEDDRELLRLTSWEGLTPGEIAMVCDIPVGRARSRLHRARGRFRAELEALGWDGERSDPVGHEEADGRLLVRDSKEER
jgi:RNA polymerase sigma-70 factor (ECF subfamily)